MYICIYIFFFFFQTILIVVTQTISHSSFFEAKSACPGRDNVETEYTIHVSSSSSKVRSQGRWGDRVVEALRGIFSSAICPNKN